MSDPLPSILPCSVSTTTQSNPHLAIVLAWLLPGSICHAPKVSPEPVCKALRSRLAACITLELELGIEIECCVPLLSTGEFKYSYVFNLMYSVLTLKSCDASGYSVTGELQIAGRPLIS